MNAQLLWHRVPKSELGWSEKTEEDSFWHPASTLGEGPTGGDDDHAQKGKGEENDGDIVI